MASPQQLLRPADRGQSGLATIRCMLTARLRELKSFVAGTARVIRCLWRKLSFTWDLDFSNLPIADYTMQPTIKQPLSTPPEQSECLLEAFYAWQKHNPHNQKTPIFTLEWDKAWRWRSEDRLLMVIKREGSKDITEPNHSYYYLLTVKRYGQTLVVEALFTDDRATGFVIDRVVFSTSETMKSKAMAWRVRKFPAGKQIQLRKLDKPALCGSI